VKNPLLFRLIAFFFFTGLCVCALLLLGAIVFFNFPDAGIWLAELLR
jgi:hypothetical protein